MMIFVVYLPHTNPARSRPGHIPRTAWLKLMSESFVMDGSREVITRNKRKVFSPPPQAGAGNPFFAEAASCRAGIMTGHWMYPGLLAGE